MCPSWYECSSCPFLVRSWPLLCTPPPPSLHLLPLKWIPGYSLRMGRRRRITRSHSPGQECALVVQSYAGQKWSHFTWIHKRGGGEVGGLEMGSGGCGGGSSYPWFLTVSAAFQVSDSKLERNIWASLPSSFPAPLLLRSHHECAKATGWPLIWYSKNRNCCLWNPLPSSSEGNLFTRRGATR